MAEMNSLNTTTANTATSMIETSRQANMLIAA